MGEKLPDDCLDVPVVDVHGRIHCAHIAVGDAAGKPRELPPDRGISKQRRCANQGDRVVGREIAPVVFERRQAQRLNQCARRIAGDDVHLSFCERSVDERQVHGSRLRLELEAVRPEEPGVTVLALEELVPEPRSPLVYLSQVLDGAQPERLCVGASHEDRERVIEAQRIEDGHASARVEIARPLEGATRVVWHSLVQDCRDGGAGVLDVGIEIA